MKCNHVETAIVELVFVLFFVFVCVLIIWAGSVCSYLLLPHGLVLCLQALSILRYYYFSHFYQSRGKNRNLLSCSFEYLFYICRLLASCIIFCLIFCFSLLLDMLPVPWLHMFGFSNDILKKPCPSVPKALIWIAHLFNNL